MIKKAVLASLVLCLVAPSVYAQGQGQRIRFNLQVEQGIAYAKKNSLPIMFYIRGSSGGDDDVEDYERDHVRVFANPAVFQTSKRFVCLQMSRSRYRDQILKWGLSRRTNLNIVFASGDGELLDQPLAASAVGSASSLLGAMQRNLRNWGNKLYQEEVKPIFDSSEAKIGDVRKALKLVSDWNMEPATQDVMKILNREKLDRTTRTACLKALAGIGSKQSIDGLVELAAAKDREAAKVLQKAPLSSVEHLLPYLGGDDLTKHVAAYTAICKICKIRSPKTERFWQGPNDAVKFKEVERVQGEANKKLNAWKNKQP